MIAGHQAGHPRGGGTPRLRMRGAVLPEAVVRDVWVADGTISLDPLPAAVTVHTGGYLIPGLVDVHCHPGTVEVGLPVDDDQLLADGAAHLRAGTTLIRVPGSGSRLPSWFGERPGLPRVVAAGLPVAVESGFFPGWGRQVGIDDVPRAAAEEAGASGWCKLIVDWFDNDTGYAATMSAAVVAAAAHAARGAGGRVAVHAQSAEGAATPP